MKLIDSLATEPRSLLERAFEQRATSHYCGDRTALTRVLGDLMLYVDTRDVNVAPHLMLNGYWEMWVTQAIARHVKPGMVCMDVGANVGYYTLLMGSLVGPKGHVHSFDVLGQNCRMIRRSADLNGLRSVVTVHECAVTDSDGDVKISVPSSTDGFSHLAHTSIASVAERRLPEEKAFPGVARGCKLDSLTGLEGRCDFLKVDVEGAEPLVWEGSRELRATYNPVLCMEYESWRTGYPAFLARMREEGYRVRYVEYDSRLVDLKDPDPERLYMLWVTK